MTNERVVELFMSYFQIGSIQAEERIKYLEANKEGPEIDRIVNEALAKEKEKLEEGLKETGNIKPLGTDREGRKYCPKCKAMLKKKEGKNGTFWGCTRWPKCNYGESWKERKTVQESKESASQKMAETFDYIEKMGGVSEARIWLGLVAKMKGEG